MTDNADTEWIKPPLHQLVRDPELLRNWNERVQGWVEMNQELAADWDAAFAFDEERKEKLWERENKIRALRRSGVPERFVIAWEKGLEETKAVLAVRTFVAADKAFLLLLGSPGCGKSVAASLALESGGYFFRAVELSRLSSFDAADRSTWADACRCNALVVDDLGAELLHDNWRPNIEELIDIRWGDRLKTVITSNLDAMTFKKRYGVRISDRIRDDGFVEICGDKSRRAATVAGVPGSSQRRP